MQIASGLVFLHIWRIFLEMIQQLLDKVEARKSFFEENSMNASAEKNEQAIRFAGYDLGPKSHICGFFRNPEEEYRLLLPFIKEGFDRGEKLFHVVNPQLRGNHVQRFESAGIDVEPSREERSNEILRLGPGVFS